jgi:hypothetical protein
MTIGSRRTMGVNQSAGPSSTRRVTIAAVISPRGAASARRTGAEVELLLNGHRPENARRAEAWMRSRFAC